MGERGTAKRLTLDLGRWRDLIDFVDPRTSHAGANRPISRRWRSPGCVEAGEIALVAGTVRIVVTDAVHHLELAGVGVEDLVPDFWASSSLSITGR
jgi:hypothetical protein